ncbi:MAG: YigZ family protein [Clostridiales bacterium]|nr:YigZ family protein [Clostridiales bacterium]
MEYKTVAKNAQAEFYEKRSRFIGHVRALESEKEAQAFIAEIKSKYWDATHNVYAYSIRTGGIKRFSDDGEPQGTAGMPVLDVIQKKSLTDCAIVVTRYFGGIQLGAGGLVRAYSRSASLALEAAGLAKMALCVRCRLTSDYGLHERVAQLIESKGGVIEDSDFAENVRLKFYLKKDKIEEFQKALSELSFGKLTCQVEEELYAKI